MEKLDKFIMMNLRNHVSDKIFTTDIYRLFDFPNKDIFEIVFKYLLKINKVKIITLKEKRLQQSEFREKMIDRYQNCIVTGLSKIECDAAHIYPVCESGSYTESNGLLLNSCIHKTFDKYLWSINPITMEIEINKNKDVGSIIQFEKKKVNIKCDIVYLIYHYNKFIENLQLN